VGDATVEMRRLKREGRLEVVDLLLLDHWEELYVEDLIVVEELELLRRGVIVADNVICLRAPAYLEYVRGGKGMGGDVEYSSREIESHMPNGWKVREYD